VASDLGPIIEHRHRAERSVTCPGLTRRLTRFPDENGRDERLVDMTHAALTPLLGHEFDNFLFASIGDDQTSSLLSVVSALARLDVDPWKEAASLTRMPKELATRRLTSLIMSLPNGSTASLSAESVADRLIALLPRPGGFKTPPPAAPLRVAPTRRSLLIGLGVLALMLIAYFTLVWMLIGLDASLRFAMSRATHGGKHGCPYVGTARVVP
jgi:hypothetical protein